MGIGDGYTTYECVFIPLKCIEMIKMINCILHVFYSNKSLHVGKIGKNDTQKLLLLAYYKHYLQSTSQEMLTEEAQLNWDCRKKYQ